LNKGDVEQIEIILMLSGLEDNDLQVTLEWSSTTNLDLLKQNQSKKESNATLYVVNNTRYAFIASLLSKNFEQHRRRIVVGK
jgi:Mg/Co/Ni transporter MgtE